MRYEWDEDKRQANLEKHGLDFVDIRLFDWETARLEEDFFPGERRDRALGYLGLRLVLVIYTYDGETCRLISMRRADARERRDADARERRDYERE